MSMIDLLLNRLSQCSRGKTWPALKTNSPSELRVPSPIDTPSPGRKHVSNMTRYPSAIGFGKGRALEPLGSSRTCSERTGSEVCSTRGAAVDEQAAPEWLLPLLRQGWRALRE